MTILIHIDHERTVKIGTCCEALSTATSFHFLQVKLQASRVFLIFPNGAEVDSSICSYVG